MAISFSYEHADEEEDYIDMEVSSSTTLLYYPITSPPQHREFEFQMSSASLEREPSTSPADELFYKGNLLPLHLPPRLQMVEKLLHNHNSINASTENKAELSEENYSTPFTTTPTATSYNTPFESCNISPSESCRVSGELNPDEYFFEFPSGTSSFMGDQPKKSWSKKLKLIRQSSLSLKLKASRAYIKSLFSKSGCSDEFSAKAAMNEDKATVSKAKEYSNKYVKVTKKNPFGQIHRERYQITSSSSVRTDTHTEKEKMMENGGGCGGGGAHRRSFSGAIKRHSATKYSSSSSFSSGSSSSSSSSSSFWSNPSGFYELQFLRSSSANSEIESSIQGAIAHCKQSQHYLSSLIVTNIIT
ncbi:probable membrane-associated kinase regulator 4 isoform X2 [Telopea speciosissima]|uniref:probable membrane-associated kinase regulator 4 isoform X2 n=1 Tax=Telopea speciosissima TaxID=54955 RepID=UPI001CC6EB83|nr:probable membrane-associated kinase regulator 4 isoform X2 [Telopea speciosissima]